MGMPGPLRRHVTRQMQNPNRQSAIHSQTSGHHHHTHLMYSPFHQDQEDDSLSRQPSAAHKTPGRDIPSGGLAEEMRWGGNLMDVNTDSDDGSTYQSPPEILTRYELMLNLSAHRPSWLVPRPLRCQRSAADNEDPLAGAEGT